MAKIANILAEESDTTEPEDGSQDKIKHITQRKKLNVFKKIPLPVKTYFDTDFTSSEIALIIGGETEGLSNEAHKFTFERNGQKIYIPMITGINSLNAAVASSIILFEVKKQHMVKQ